MNQIRSQKVAPPRWIEAIVKWLMPRSAAARLEDLNDYNLPALELAWKAAGTISASNVTWTRRAFNLERVLAVASVLSIPFWGTPLLPPVAVVAPAVGALGPRAACTYLRDRTAPD